MIIVYVCLFHYKVLSSDLFIFFHPHLLYKPYVGICRATCYQSNQTANVCGSYSPVRGPGIGGSVSDRSTVATEVSKPMCYRSTFTLTSDNLASYIIQLVYWSFYNDTAHVADILTQTTVVQGVHTHSWGLYCNRCYCICICVCPNQGWWYRLHLYPLGGIFYSP